MNVSISLSYILSLLPGGWVEVLFLCCDPIVQIGNSQLTTATFFVVVVDSHVIMLS